MSEEIKYNTDSKSSEHLLREQEMNLEAGLLGKCFGAKSRAPFNIAGVLIIFLAFIGGVILFVPASISAKEYWSLILPVITLALGYIFGKES